MRKINYPEIEAIETAIYNVMDEYKNVYVRFLYHESVVFHIDYVLSDEEYYADEDFYKELKEEERSMKDFCQYDMDKLDSAYQELRVARLNMCDYYDIHHPVSDKFDDEGLDTIYGRFVTDADIEEFIRNSEYWTMK